MAGATEDLKQRCEQGGLGFEHDEAYPDLLHVRYRRGTGIDYVEVWGDDEARALLQEPFERYEGLDGFEACWSATEGVIECGVIWVDTSASQSSPIERPPPDATQKLRRSGFQVGNYGRLNSSRRMEVESIQGLSVFIGPCSTLHGVLHYDDFLEPEVANSASRHLTLRIKGADAKDHAEATKLLERVEGTELSRISDTVGVSLALKRNARTSGPEQTRHPMLPLESRLFWGKTVGVTGSDPYNEAVLKKIVLLEEGIIGDADIWQTNQLIIVGREAFDKSYLRRSIEFGLEHGFVCRYLAQEDFWHYWMGGEETTYHAGDPRIANHPGLSFIASVGFKWPSIEAVQGLGGTGELSEKLNKTHLLKSRFGYSVGRGTIAEERRKKLSRAITGAGAIGLREVADHIAMLIRINRLRHDDRMLYAIERWESDLDWLYHLYYEGKSYSFVWPETR